MEAPIVETMLGSPLSPPPTPCALSPSPVDACVATSGVDYSDCKPSLLAVWEQLEATCRMPTPGSSPASPTPSSSAHTLLASADDTVELEESERVAPSPSKSLEELLYEFLVEDSDVELESELESDAAEICLTEPAVAASADGTGLFDDSDNDDTSARTPRTRLRRGDETSHWHPPLPKAPERHPSTNQRNFYDGEAAWDYSAHAPISRLLDAQGELLHRCYLVQWKGRPLQMSWVWAEQLDNATTRSMMQQVDDWKDLGSSEPFTTLVKERDVASEAGTCFMDALRSALYYLGQPSLVTMETWDGFEGTRPPEIQYGVSRDDVTEFFKLLQRQSVPLNYDRLMVNIHTSSSANLRTLRKFCGTLEAGAYIVSAGEDGLGHCFVVISHGPGQRLVALDDYNTSRDPPMVVIPLSYQRWIKHVKWMCRVELKPGYKCRHGKRKSKTQRNREKRVKQQQQQ